MTTPPASVIIPAYNEEPGISRVIADIPRDLISEIIVVDNGSTDRTAMKAREAGARVVFQPDRGYGSACLAGIAALPPATEAWFSFWTATTATTPPRPAICSASLEEHQADLVLGSRTLGCPEPGSLTPQQRFGNWLSTAIIRMIYGHAYTDLGPFRAIRREALSRLGMQDRTYGWTVEMQVKALQQGLKVVEIPVRYRPRLGRSKVSGTLSGTVKAGLKILWTIARLSLRRYPS